MHVFQSHKQQQNFHYKAACRREEIPQKFQTYLLRWMKMGSRSFRRNFEASKIANPHSYVSCPSALISSLILLSQETSKLSFTTKKHGALCSFLKKIQSLEPGRTAWFMDIHISVPDADKFTLIFVRPFNLVWVIKLTSFWTWQYISFIMIPTIHIHLPSSESEKTTNRPEINGQNL